MHYNKVLTSSTEKRCFNKNQWLPLRPREQAARGSSAKAFRGIRKKPVISKQKCTSICDALLFFFFDIHF